MSDTLAEICIRKKEHIKAAKRERSEASLLATAEQAQAPRGFMQALKRNILTGRFALIAELKKASPSKGIIRADFSPPRLAEAYAKGGATCLSVLTDEPYFQGRDEYLTQAKEAVELPVLRKDFMLEPYQIIESRALGADCILLIMAALSNTQAQELLAASHQLGMDALIEVHNTAEAERALTHLDAKMIGINNRDLKTLSVDLAVAERIAPMLPASILGVGESGLSNTEDLKRLSHVGINAFLVGESLMREQDVEKATKALLGS